MPPNTSEITSLSRHLVVKIRALDDEVFFSLATETQTTCCSTKAYKSTNCSSFFHVVEAFLFLQSGRIFEVRSYSLLKRRGWTMQFGGAGISNVSYTQHCLKCFSFYMYSNMQIRLLARWPSQCTHHFLEKITLNCCIESSFLANLKIFKWICTPTHRNAPYHLNAVLRG